jgi:hypothetical protein
MEKKSTKFQDLVGTRFQIAIGNCHITGTWTEEKLIEQIKSGIVHYLYDRDFHYNWTRLEQEYYSIFKEETLNPMMKDIDNTINDFFAFQRTAMGEVFEFKLEWRDSQKIIDKWFQENKTISKELKRDYYSYRKEYAGIDLDSQ